MFLFESHDSFQALDNHLMFFDLSSITVGTFAEFLFENWGKKEKNLKNATVCRYSVSTTHHEEPDRCMAYPTSFRM